jgi:hypothetical protein
VRDAISQKVSKNLKVVCARVTQTKTDLSTEWTFSPLGVKLLWIMKIFERIVFVDRQIEIKNDAILFLFF